MAAGLLLLLGAQIAGDWLYEPFFQQFYQKWNHGPPAVVAEHWGRILALILVLAATYAYTYSDLIVRRVGVYIYLAVCTLLWAEVLVIELLPVPMTTEVAIIALAVTALAANLFAPSASRWQQSLRARRGGRLAGAFLQPLQQAGMPLGLALSTLPVLLGIVLHLRATYVGWPLPDGQPYTVGWLYVFAMLITAVACRIGAHLYRHTVPWLSATYIFGTAAATLVGAAGLLSVLGMKTWDILGPVLMVIPILYADRGAALSGTCPGKPLGVGRPDRHGRHARGRAGGLRRPDAAARRRAGGRPETVPLAGIGLRRGRGVLPPDGPVPQAGRQRVSLHGDRVRRRVAIAAVLAGGPGILHAHVRAGGAGAVDRVPPGDLGACPVGPGRRSIARTP